MTKPLTDEEFDNWPKDQSLTAAWWLRYKLRQFDADPWLKELHDLPPFTQQAHDQWRAELVADYGFDENGRIKFPNACLRQGLALAGRLKEWQPSPCQRFADAPCTCHNAMSQAGFLEANPPAGRREYVVEDISDEAWKLVDGQLQLSTRRARAGNALSDWRQTFAAAVTWAVNECPWERLFLKNGEPSIGSALRQRLGKINVERLRALEKQLDRDASVEDDERQALLITTTKLINHLSRAGKPPVKTASEVAA